MQFLLDGVWDNADKIIKEFVHSTSVQKQRTRQSLNRLWFRRLLIGGGCKPKKANKCWELCQDEDGTKLDAVYEGKTKYLLMYLPERLNILDTLTGQRTAGSGKVADSPFGASPTPMPSVVDSNSSHAGGDGLAARLAALEDSEDGDGEEEGGESEEDSNAGDLCEDSDGESPIKRMRREAALTASPGDKVKDGAILKALNAIFQARSNTKKSSTIDDHFTASEVDTLYAFIIGSPDSFPETIDMWNVQKAIEYHAMGVLQIHVVIGVCVWGP